MMVYIFYKAVVLRPSSNEHWSSLTNSTSHIWYLAGCSHHFKTLKCRTWTSKLEFSRRIRRKHKGRSLFFVREQMMNQHLLVKLAGVNSDLCLSIEHFLKHCVCVCVYEGVWWHFVCSSFSYRDVLQRDKKFYGLREQQGHTHRDNAFVTLLWNATGHYYVNEHLSPLLTTVWSCCKEPRRVEEWDTCLNLFHKRRVQSGGHLRREREKSTRSRNHNQIFIARQLRLLGHSFLYVKSKNDRY